VETEPAEALPATEPAGPKPPPRVLVVGLAIGLVVVVVAIGVLYAKRPDRPGNLSLRFTSGNTRDYSISVDDSTDPRPGQDAASGIHITALLKTRVTSVDGSGTGTLSVLSGSTTISVADGSFNGNDLLAQTITVDQRGRPDAMLALTSDSTGAGSFYGDLIFPVVPTGSVGLGATWPIDLSLTMAQGEGTLDYTGTGTFVRYETLNGVRAAVVQNKVSLDYGYTLNAGKESALVVKGGDPKAPGSVQVSGSGTYSMLAWIDPATGELLRSQGQGTYDLSSTYRGFPSSVGVTNGQSVDASGQYTQQVVAQS
jgi:hypothetical protein